MSSEDLNTRRMAIEQLQARFPTRTDFSEAEIEETAHVLEDRLRILEEEALHRLSALHNSRSFSGANSKYFRLFMLFVFLPLACLVLAFIIFDPLSK